MNFDPDHVPRLWQVIAALDGDAGRLDALTADLNLGKMIRMRWDWEIAVSEFMREVYSEHLPSDLQDDQGPLQDHARWLVSQGEATVRAVMAEPSSIPTVSDRTRLGLGVALDDLVKQRHGCVAPWVPAGWLGSGAPKR